MSPLADVSVPVLSCDEARALETALFDGSEAREWQAMQAAGRAIAAAIRTDFEEIGGLPDAPRLLVLVGKGHNGGDALIAADEILRTSPRATAVVAFVFGQRALRPLASRAWRGFAEAAGDRIVVSAPSGIAGADGRGGFDLCLDGVFGFQFRPPVDAGLRSMLERVNALRIRFRAAVDLPSADLFQADFTYATGAVKSPVLRGERAGRIRYLDLGFFAASAARESTGDAMERVLTLDVLRELRGFRPPRSDKRAFGHVFLLGGSRGYPGAILMSTLAALRSGAGLVTAFVPESLTASFAARLPEAIWVGWPETPAGGLALEGEVLLRARIERADALVIGPGLGREPETLALAQSVVAASAVPLVLDADALQPDIVVMGNAPRVVTPHAGEFKRIAGEQPLREFADRHPQLTVVRKGPVTAICDGGAVLHSLFGGPVLARGGSGDLLAGMIGTQLAQTPRDPAGAAARAVVWHGAAADALARAQGQVAVETTQLLDHLGVVLR